MNGPCVYERQVVAALCSRTLTDELRAHAAHCAECSESVALATVLRREAAKAAVASLPDASIIWWKAQLRRQREAVKRATFPIRLAQGLAALLATVALLVLRSLPFPGWLTPAMESAVSSNPLILASGTLSVVCAAAGAVYLALAERVHIHRP